MPKNILIHREKEELVFQKAAQVVIDVLELNKVKKVLLLLSGGSAVGTYDRIKNLEFRIKNLGIGQVDERYFGENPKSKFQISNKIPNPNFKYQYSAEDINAYQIGKTGLWEAYKENHIPYYLISQEGTLAQSAEKYDRQMEKLFKEYDYKIAILGIGEDGHTAGMLPGYEKLWNIDKFAVGYKIGNGQNNAGAVFCPKVFKQRITITPKTLQMLDQTIVIACGEKKQSAIKNAIDPSNLDKLNKYPAAIIQKIKKADLFTDHLSL